MTASELYRDCFWCGKVYDFWRNEGCPACGSRLEADALGGLAGEYNKRPDYDGPDPTDALEARQAIAEEYRERLGQIYLY